EAVPRVPPSTGASASMPYAAHGSRVPSQSNEGAHDAHTALAHREDVDPADHGSAGRAEAPRLDASVGADVGQAVLLQQDVCRSVVKDPLGAVVEGFPAHA